MPLDVGLIDNPANLHTVIQKDNTMENSKTNFVWMKLIDLFAFTKLTSRLPIWFTSYKTPQPRILKKNGTQIILERRKLKWSRI